MSLLIQRKQFAYNFVVKISESDELFVDGHAIEWKNHVKYLGNIVNNTLTGENDQTVVYKLKC